MNAKQSLEDNKAEILMHLPQEFHADFEKSLQDVQDFVPMDNAEVKAQVAKDLPDDLKSEADNIEKEIDVPAPVVSKQEEKEEILKALPDDLKAEFEKNWKG